MPRTTAFFTIEVPGELLPMRERPRIRDAIREARAVSEAEETTVEVRYFTHRGAPAIVVYRATWRDELQRVLGAELWEDPRS